MASRLRRGVETAGVVLSVILSTSSFALAFLNFYFDHLKSSEAVHVSVEQFSLRKENDSKPASLTVAVVFVNKGDNSVTVSDVWFEFDDGSSTCCGSMLAYKDKEEEVVSPISLPPMQVPKVRLRTVLEPFLAAPTGITIHSEGEAPSSGPTLVPPSVKIEKISVALRFTIIGPSHGRQVMTIPLGILHYKDGEPSGLSHALGSYELNPIRKDPPFLRSLWNSWSG